jgi:hypothetical protein
LSSKPLFSPTKKAIADFPKGIGMSQMTEEHRNKSPAATASLAPFPALSRLAETWKPFRGNSFYNRVTKLADSIIGFGVHLPGWLLMSCDRKTGMPLGCLEPLFIDFSVNLIWIKVKESIN